MTEHTITGDCPACQAMDRADGAEDGWLVPKLQHKVKNENWLVKSLSRTQDRVADAITGFAGSLQFVYLHSLWFGLWIVLNIGLAGAALVFDRYPFGLLTMIVSLEAIFLSTFVMIGQNRQAAFQQVRADHDFQTQELELKTNTELTREIHLLTEELHRRYIGPSS